MAGGIFEAIANVLGERLAVVICSMIPIIELRGAIPLGAYYGLPWWQSYVFAVIGNMLPVPFILLLIKGVISWMINCKSKFFNKIGNFLQRKSDKNREKIEKYGFWGLTVFIGIPLPVTGAWTGSLVAGVIKMNFWRAMLSALLGVMMAGVIMTLASYGVVGFLKIFM